MEAGFTLKEQNRKDAEWAETDDSVGKDLQRTEDKIVTGICNQRSTNASDKKLGHHETSENFSTKKNRGTCNR